MFKWILIIMTTIGSTVVINAQSNNLDHEDMGILYVLHAKKGQIEKVKGTYQLTLLNSEKSIAYFSETPEKESGKLPIDRFVYDWKKARNSFANNPPKAGIAIIDADREKQKKYQDEAFILYNPRYIKKNSRLTFDITPQSKNPPENDSLEEITLFIDQKYIQ